MTVFSNWKIRVKALPHFAGKHSPEFSDLSKFSQKFVINPRTFVLGLVHFLLNFTA